MDITTQQLPNLNHHSKKSTTIHSINSLDANTPITNLYLTFTTTLPYPPPSTHSSSLPPPPNLTPFTDPHTWSHPQKLCILCLSCAATFLTAYSAGSYSPPADLIAHDLDTSRLAILAGITTFCAGFALVPMALAPISEIWGRYAVFACSGVVFVVAQVVCGLVTNLAGMLVARFFVGFGASSFSSVVGGVLADVWHKEDRNTPMALFSAGVMCGTGAGPLVGGLFVLLVPDDSLAWKWSFWHQSIIDGIMLMMFILFYRETRGSVLLSRKASKLNKWYEELEAAGVYGVHIHDSELNQLASIENPSASSSISSRISDSSTSLKRVRWKIKDEEERASLATILSMSIIRPFYLLSTEPVVLSFALWASFAWGILYLAFAAIPYLHGSDYSATSKTYGAMIIGSVVATLVSIWQNELLQHPLWKAECRDTKSALWAFMRRRFPSEAPESRLYFACVTGALLPIGLFGAFMAPSTGSQDDNGTSLAIGFGFAAWGIYAIYLASFNYMADTYHLYASSALAANSFLRNVIGGGFPLVTALMFDDLGIKGAGGLLAGLAAVLTATPWVLVFWGSRIRARSKMASLLQK